MQSRPKNNPNTTKPLFRMKGEKNNFKKSKRRKN